MHTLASVYEKLLPHLNKRIACAVQANKGCAGILMEKLAGIPQTSNILDCVDGEVKSFPLTINRKGFIVPQETVAVTMVKPESLLTVPFAESNVYKKLAHTLYLPLLREGDNVSIRALVVHTIEHGSLLYKQLEEDYNAIAARVMQDLGVPINDLNAWITPRFEAFHKPKDLHYTEAGSAYLAEKVAKEIAAALGK
jgi:hypothetical protein